MNPAEEYILNQTETFKNMLLRLQVLVETTVPGVDLLFKYKIPFYYLKGKPFCYLNVTKSYVDVGFWNASRLTKHSEHMTTAGRKFMKSLRYYAEEDINDTIAIEVLEEAFEVHPKP